MYVSKSTHTHSTITSNGLGIETASEYIFKIKYLCLSQRPRSNNSQQQHTYSNRKYYYLLELIAIQISFEFELLFVYLTWIDTFGRVGMMKVFGNIDARAANRFSHCGNCAVRMQLVKNVLKDHGTCMTTSESFTLVARARHSSIEKGIIDSRVNISAKRRNGNLHYRPAKFESSRKWLMFSEHCVESGSISRVARLANITRNFSFCRWKKKSGERRKHGYTRDVRFHHSNHFQWKMRV